MPDNCDADAVMLFQGASPHPAHQTFGDAIDADYRHFESGKPPMGENQDRDSELSRIWTGLSLSRDYDVAIAEGSAPLQTLLVYSTRVPNTTAIFLAADETFYDLPERRAWEVWNRLTPVTTRLLDGIVSISDDVTQSVQFLGDSIPLRKVYPPISNAKFERLASLEPASPCDPTPLILTAGTVKPANNHSLLVGTLEYLRERTSDEYKLTILGAGHNSQPYASSDWINTPGYVEVDEFVDWFSKATLYVQPSVGDGFSVAAAEGMLSGTPTVVSTRVGVRELLTEEVIAEPTVDSLADVIKHVTNMPRDNRVQVGRNQRGRVETLTEANQAEAFRSVVKEFLG